MKSLSERMLKEYLRHDARYDGGLDVPAPPLKKWAAEVEDLEDTKDGYRALYEQAQDRIEALERILKSSKVRLALCACGFHGFEDVLAHNPCCPYRFALAAEEKT